MSNDNKDTSFKKCIGCSGAMTTEVRRSPMAMLWCSNGQENPINRQNFQLNISEIINHMKLQMQLQIQREEKGVNELSEHRGSAVVVVIVATTCHEPFRVSFFGQLQFQLIQNSGG